MQIVHNFGKTRKITNGANAFSNPCPSMQFYKLIHKFKQYIVYIYSFCWCKHFSHIRQIKGELHNGKHYFGRFWSCPNHDRSRDPWYSFSISAAAWNDEEPQWMFIFIKHNSIIPQNQSNPSLTFFNNIKISKSGSPINRYSIVRNKVGLRQIQSKTLCLYHLKEVR